MQRREERRKEKTEEGKGRWRKEREGGGGEREKLRREVDLTEKVDGYRGQRRLGYPLAIPCGDLKYTLGLLLFFAASPLVDANILIIRLNSQVD